MTKTISTLDAVVIEHALSTLVASDSTPGRLALKIARNAVKLEPITKPYHEGRNAIIAGLGGRIDRDDAETWAKFEAEIGDLEASIADDPPVEVEFTRIPATLLDAVDVRGKMLSVLLAHDLVAFETM